MIATKYQISKHLGLPVLLELFEQREEHTGQNLRYTANIFEVIFTVFYCVPIFNVVSLYGLRLIAAPSTVE